MGLIYLAFKNIFVQKERSLAFFLTISLSISIILLLVFITLGMRNNLIKGHGEIESVYTLKMKRTNLNMTYRGIPVGQQETRELKELPFSVQEYFKSNPEELKLISLSLRKISIIPFNGIELIAVGSFLPVSNPLGEQALSIGYKLRKIPDFQGSIINLPGLGDVRINNFQDKTGTEKDNIIFYPVKELPSADIIRFTSQLTSVRDIKGILTNDLSELVNYLDISGESKENNLRFSFFDKLINYFIYIILLMIVPVILLFNVFGSSIIRGREKDIAVLRVVGFRKKDISILVLIELGFIGITSSFTGILISVPMIFMVENSGILPDFIIADIGIPLISIIAFATASVVLSLSGIAPVSRAAELDPVTAFRIINQ